VADVRRQSGSHAGESRDPPAPAVPDRLGPQARQPDRVPCVHLGRGRLRLDAAREAVRALDGQRPRPLALQPALLGAGVFAGRQRRERRRAHEGRPRLRPRPRDRQAALDLRRHRLLWTAHTGCKITAAVALVGDRLYVGDYCGRLLALSTRGRLLFSASAGSPVYGSAAVAGGRIFVPSRDAGALYAFTTTGRTLWSVRTGSYVYSAPAVWQGRVFFGSYNGYLYGVSASSGRVLWTAYAGGRVSGSPAVIDGIVYAGSFGHQIIGVDARTGRIVFRFPHGEYVPLSANRGRLLLYGWSSLWALAPRSRK
jgi:hypothetical protein